MLFEQYYKSLVLFSCCYVPNEDIGKDIVQDIFLTIIENQQRFDNIQNLKAYLYNSVKNNCLKYLRHQNVEKKYNDYISKELESELYYADKILEEEVYDILIREIELLPESSRKVFRLAIQGKNNMEIADILNLSVETVKSHKKNGKKILSKKINDAFVLMIFLSKF